MLRVMLVCLALTGFGAAARAGELDREAAPAKPAAVAKLDPAVKSGSEMDKESPAEAYYRRGYWGGYRGHYGGWGYRPHFGYGYGWGYRPYYGGWGYPGYY